MATAEVQVNVRVVPGQLASRVEIHLYTQALPVVIEGVLNAYTKGPLYCVARADGKFDKFPIRHIFRIRESLTA